MNGTNTAITPPCRGPLKKRAIHVPEPAQSITVTVEDISVRIGLEILTSVDGKTRKRACTDGKSSWQLSSMAITVSLVRVFPDRCRNFPPPPSPFFFTWCEFWSSILCFWLNFDGVHHELQFRPADRTAAKVRAGLPALPRPRGCCVAEPRGDARSARQFWSTLTWCLRIGELDSGGPSVPGAGIGLARGGWPRGCPSGGQLSRSR